MNEKALIIILKYNKENCLIILLIIILDMKKIYFPIICSLIFTSIIYLINLNQGQNDSHITRNLQFNSTDDENYFNQCQVTINTLFTSNLFYFKKKFTLIIVEHHYIRIFMEILLNNLLTKYKATKIYLVII